MAENMSLADKAVQALAAVNAMDEGIDIGHPERHAVRNLKRIAEQSIDDGLKRAIDLAWQASDLRDLVREMKPSNAPSSPAAKQSGATSG